MAKIGYIMTAPGYNDYEADVKKLTKKVKTEHPEILEINENIE
jgi:hypothetical protein